MKSRYRRGWFGDSQRHYLAAKGIKTKPYFSKKYYAQGEDEEREFRAAWTRAKNTGRDKFDWEGYEIDTASVNETMLQGEELPKEEKMEESSVVERTDAVDEVREKLKTEPVVKDRYGDKFFNLTHAATSVGDVSRGVGSELAGMAKWFNTVEYYSCKNKEKKKKEFYRGLE